MTHRRIAALLLSLAAAFSVASAEPTPPNIVFLFADDQRADTIGQRELVVQVLDREGEPVQGLTVRVDAYHMARAGDPVA